MRAALDPTLSATALRLLVYMGAVTDNGGHSRFSIAEVAKALKTSEKEVRIARHQLIRLKYIKRWPRAILDDAENVIGKQWCYGVLLVSQTVGRRA